MKFAAGSVKNQLGSAWASTKRRTKPAVGAKSIFTREPTDGESVWNPIIGDWLQPAIEDVLQPRHHKYGAKADHAVVAWDGAISLYVHHYIRHRGCLGCAYSYVRSVDSGAGIVFQAKPVAVSPTHALDKIIHVSTTSAGVRLCASIFSR
jgi:hypothetical protein